MEMDSAQIGEGTLATVLFGIGAGPIGVIVGVAVILSLDRSELFGGQHQIIDPKTLHGGRAFSGAKNRVVDIPTNGRSGPIARVVLVSDNSPARPASAPLESAGYVQLVADTTCKGQWIPEDTPEVGVPTGRDLRTGSALACLFFWACVQCNGSPDLYNNDRDRPFTAGELLGSGDCFCIPPGRKTGCPANKPNP